MNKKVVLLFILALLLRLVLIPVAHHGDLNNNISWGQELFSRGVVDFYGSSDANAWPYSAPNQPPLYLFLFGLTVWVFNTVQSLFAWLNQSIGVFPSSLVWWWDAMGMDIVVKLPGILADLGVGYMIYHYFAKDKKKALMLTSVWLFNPFTWYSSGIWGQTDSLINLIGLLAVITLLNKNIVKFAALFTIGFLFKASLGIFIPVFAVVLFLQKHSLAKWGRATGISLLIVFATSIWFHPRLDFPLWIVDLYTQRILPGEIGYLTANAFNFWWLIDSGKTLDSTLYFGLTARVWGIIITLVGIVSSLLIFRNKKITDKKLFFALCVAALFSFTFMTRIHERYLYPFFPYATLLLGMMPSMWLIYITLSAAHLLNIYHLFWAPSLPWLEMLYTHSNFTNLLSLVTVVITLSYLTKSRHIARK